jgi:hypothetical protein
VATSSLQVPSPSTKWTCSACLPVLLSVTSTTLHTSGGAIISSASLSPSGTLNPKPKPYIYYATHLWWCNNLFGFSFSHQVPPPPSPSLLSTPPPLSLSRSSSASEKREAQQRAETSGVCMCVCVCLCVCVHRACVPASMCDERRVGMPRGNRNAVSLSLSQRRQNPKLSTLNPKP